MTFDENGDGSLLNTVGYAYNLDGQRTALTLPDSKTITYGYNTRRQLSRLTDWDDQTTYFAYDGAGRHVLTDRANRLRSRYTYDAGGRLRLLRHTAGPRTFAQFAYEVDRRGNRTQALELLRHPGTGTTTISHTDPAVTYRGDWTDTGTFQQTDSFSASLSLLLFGSEDVMLTMGTGPDHGLFDVYIGGSLWESFDGYAAVADERIIEVALRSDGPYLLEIRNRVDRNPNSSGSVLRFKSLSTGSIYDLRTIVYAYDALSRLQSAAYHPDSNIQAEPFRTYAYTFDMAGNRLSETIDGVPTSYTYNRINQLVSDGSNTLTYDANGNMTSDGVNSYAWDRANRLLSMGGISYQYNGDGNRIQQDALKYILDLQPGLAQVIGDSDGNRYIHSPRGIHAVNDGAAWTYPVMDALGSVRGYIGGEYRCAVERELQPVWRAGCCVGWLGLHRRMAHQQRHTIPSSAAFESGIGRVAEPRSV